MDSSQRRLGYRRGIASRAQGVMLKAAAIAATGIMLVSAIALSIVFFAVAIVVVGAIGGYLWWKTRDLRRQLKAQQADIIEGVVIREVDVRQVEHHGHPRE